MVNPIWSTVSQSRLDMDWSAEHNTQPKDVSDAVWFQIESELKHLHSIYLFRLFEYPYSCGYNNNKPSPSHHHRLVGINHSHSWVVYYCYTHMSIKHLQQHHFFGDPEIAPVSLHLSKARTRSSRGSARDFFVKWALVPSSSVGQLAQT